MEMFVDKAMNVLCEDVVLVLTRGLSGWHILNVYSSNFFIFESALRAVSKVPLRFACDT